MPIILAAALQQAEGGGNPMKTVGFILVLVLGGAAFYLLLMAENKAALGAICAAFAVMILWVMAGLPLPPIHKVLFPSEGMIIPTFAFVRQNRQAQTNLATAIALTFLLAWQGAWFYIPAVWLGVIVSCWPQIQQVPAMITSGRRSR